MRRTLRRLRYEVGLRQFATAGFIVLGSAAVAATGRWVFRARPVPARDVSLWALLLSDRWTLGFAQVSVFLLAIYSIASIAALVAGGRWIKGFGAGGLTADDAAEAERKVLDLKRELEDTRRMRDLALGVLSGRGHE